MKLPLELAQVTQERCDLRGFVFIALVQTNEGIQNQEQGAKVFHGQGEALAVARQI